MGCGEFVPGFRIPRFSETPFQGVMEHLCVQADFLTQVARLPHAEYSIPRAGKNPAEAGYADIVAVATREIWEIKPERRLKEAEAEAKHYVEKANAACGLSWKAGETYRAAGRCGSPNVVFETSGGPLVAELHAWQPQRDASVVRRASTLPRTLVVPGAVLYKWRVRGRKKEELSPYELRAARLIVAEQYFPGRSVIVKANDPDGPPIDIEIRHPRIAAGHSAFAPLADRLLATAASSVPRFVAGGAYEVSVERSVFDGVVQAASRAAGEARIRQFRHDAQALPDAIRRTSAVAVSLGAVAVIGTAATVVAVLGEWIAVSVGTGVAAAGAAVEVTAVVAAPAGATVIYLTPAAAKATATAALAAGAMLILMPSPARAQETNKPVVPATASVPRFDLLYPGQARDASIGRIRDLDGGQWVTIAVIRYD